MQSIRSEMQKKGKTVSRQLKKLAKLARIPMLLLFVSIYLAISCTGYNPALYPSYDVLNPGQEVTMNPLRVVEDGFVVNDAFLMHYRELWEEVKKLRKK